MFAVSKRGGFHRQLIYIATKSDVSGRAINPPSRSEGASAGPDGAGMVLPRSRRAHIYPHLKVTCFWFPLSGRHSGCHVNNSVISV